MTAPPAPPAPPVRWLPLVASILFAVAYTQPSLYYSNQNQYFLHGLAQAGVGDLKRDWLANTADPTPAFTAAIHYLAHDVGTWPFHAIFFAFLMLYFLSLWVLARELPYFPATLAGQALLAGGLIAIHSGIARAGSVAVAGVDYPWYFQAGVANQYVLGAGLQPSVAGVFLLTALAAYATRWVGFAGLCVAVACGIHSTYLLPGAFLVIGMLIRHVWVDWDRTKLLFWVALLGVVPTVAYTVYTFGSKDPDRFKVALTILANVRIPHHTDVNQWLDGVAGIQLAWLVVGVAGFRRTPVFVPLLTATLLGFGGSIAQVYSGDPTFALLFPWRISVVLVPVATAAGLTFAVHLIEQQLPSWISAVLASVLGVGAVVGAGAVYEYKLGYQETRAEANLIERVAKVRRPGEVYLLPTGFPNPPSSRGSSSSSFVPIKQSNTPAIFELQRFRLGTGAAVYVDFKSIPYRDDEVVEWRRRVSNADRWYATPDWDASGVIREVIREGLTHVVIPADSPVRSDRFELHTDATAYRVYKIVN